MFDIGIGELLVIGIIAILLLGPEKLPKALVDLAKFIKAVKKTLNDAKESLDKEIRLDELKSQAHEYKQIITDTTNELSKITELPRETKDIEKPKNLEPVEPIIHVPGDKKGA